MLYSDLFAWALRRCAGNELPTAIEVLIEDSFSLSRSRFWIQKNQVIRDAKGVRRFRRRLRRLLAGEPLAYILREKEFFGHAFAVSPAVLVPRPETELLVEKALELLGGKAARVLDIGAGSGCIAISIALHAPVAVTALEKSRPALRVLKRNIERFKLLERVHPQAGDLFPPAGEPYEMIVANPPYLSRGDLRQAPRSVRFFEPAEALVAGAKGTEALERIIAGAPRQLAPGGRLLLEIGQGQRRSVSAFLKAAGLREVECVRDYAGIERVIVAQKDR
ncbi:MAG: peptide chain release factor N(5)-glutamine methyltransferase [Acidobacteria bacterium]|nr:peptide chain release factor N(5)-glutamine methyltransferase [Acidobacteriota bacterium]